MSLRNLTDAYNNTDSILQLSTDKKSLIMQNIPYKIIGRMERRN